MSLEKVKILFMGKEISHEELPEAPAAALEDHFAPVQLSPLAIDRASQLVPEEHWKPTGLHTWLAARANAAFRKLTTSQTKIRLGRLEYVFEFDAHGPVLKTVILK